MIEKSQLPGNMAAMMTLAKEYSAFMNFGLWVVETVDEKSAELQKEFKTTKLPQFRFYPNMVKGAEKREKSFEIYVPKKGSTEKVTSRVRDEIVDNFVHDVKNVDEKVYH